MKRIISLQSIINDKTSGSSEILYKLNTYILNSIKSQSKIKSAIKQAKDKLSHFEVVNSYIASIEILLNSKDLTELQDFLLNFSNETQSKYQRIYYNAKPYLRNINNILTLSNSITLYEIFKLLKQDNKKLKVIVCESRPNLEGRIFTKALLSANIKVELIYDFMISLYIPKVDAVIIGADQILKNGNVINKTGSTAAAILCRHFKNPFYVLASKDKFSIKGSYKSVHKNNKEVWEVSRKNLKISNVYFEEVPASLITKIITD